VRQSDGLEVSTWVTAGSDIGAAEWELGTDVIDVVGHAAQDSVSDESPRPNSPPASALSRLDSSGIHPEIVRSAPRDQQTNQRGHVHSPRPPRHRAGLR